MKISEYDLLCLAWERSFPFMLKHIGELLEASDKVHPDAHYAGELEERCLSELNIALKELGVEYQIIHAWKSVVPTVDSRRSKSKGRKS